MTIYDILGLIFGALGTIGVVQLAYTIVCYNLPQEKLKSLDEVLDATRLLFDSVVEEGLLPDKRFVQKAAHRLQHYRELTEGLRSEVHSATSFTEKCHAMLSGLSRKISTLRNQIEKLRAVISSTSSKARRELRDNSSNCAISLDAKLEREGDAGNGMEEYRKGRKQLYDNHNIRLPPPVYSQIGTHCHSVPGYCQTIYVPEFTSHLVSSGIPARTSGIPSFATMVLENNCRNPASVPLDDCEPLVNASRPGKRCICSHLSEADVHALEHVLRQMLVALADVRGQQAEH
ncbi:unnamed protein product [Somion occarium]|uniref:Fungal N-terminal domain-containing protein n=1 Tax=Somion occarium TaxID=3059160 RepID=A0ABP1DYN8_9APHY